MTQLMGSATNVTTTALFALTSQKEFQLVRFARKEATKSTPKASAPHLNAQVFKTAPFAKAPSAQHATMASDWTKQDSVSIVLTAARDAQPKRTSTNLLKTTIWKPLAQKQMPPDSFRSQMTTVAVELVVTTSTVIAAAAVIQMEIQ